MHTPNRVTLASLSWWFAAATAFLLVAVVVLRYERRDAAEDLPGSKEGLSSAAMPRPLCCSARANI
jgi:hypothetical protein